MPANHDRIAAGSATWEPPGRLRGKVDRLIEQYRALVQEVLGSLTAAHFSALAQPENLEYRKMVELSTKMTVVGHACCEAAGFPYNARRQELSVLYGGCCFLADSFLDDYGETVAAEYLDRFELLLTQGWFEVRNARERLFYVIIARLFTERDLLDPMLRQAIYALFLAQKRDVALRMNAPSFRALARRRKLAMLRQCARDRSGHAILVLTRLLAPRLSLQRQHLLFLAGALIMFTDDHGDCHADLRAGRLTYMNQVRHPESRLRRLYQATTSRIQKGLPRNRGQRLLCAFLFRYFQTRLAKHARERSQPALSWAVYE